VAESHNGFIKRYVAAYTDHYLALVNNDGSDEAQERIQELDLKLENLRSEYKTIAGEEGVVQLDRAALGYTADSLIDATDKRIADLIVRKPVVNGANTEALRVSGIGNRYGIQILVDSGKQRFSIGVGNNSMHAFSVEAGFNQVVSVEEINRISKLQNEIKDVNKKILQINEVITAPAKMLVGVNPYAGIKSEPQKIQQERSRLIGQLNTLLDEVGATIVSRNYTDLVLPNNDVAYSRLATKIIKQNPRVNVWMDKDSGLIYTQFRSGKLLPLGEALKLANNVGLMSGDATQEVEDFIMQRIKVDDHSFAILLKHKPSNKTIAYIPPVKDSGVLEQIFKNDIDILYIDARYSNISNYYINDLEFISRASQYVSSEDMGDAIVRSYQRSTKRPKFIQLMNTDDNMQAGVVAESIKKRLIASDILDDVDVRLSPIKHNVRPDIIGISYNDIAIRAGEQSNGDIVQDAILRSQIRSREARREAYTGIEDISLVSLDDERQLPILMDAVEEINKFVNASNLDIPPGIMGDVVEPDPLIKYGISSETFNVVADPSVINTSAEEWINLHVRPKDPVTIEEIVKKFKISGQGVDLRTAPYKESLITSIRTAILSQDEFDKIIDWQSIKRADGSARFVSSIDAWAEFNRLIRDYTWVVPHFSPRIDWFKHEQDAINMVSTSGMLSEIDDSQKLVRVFKGRAARAFTNIDKKLFKNLNSGDKGTEFIIQRSKFIKNISKLIIQEVATNNTTLNNILYSLGLSDIDINITRDNAKDLSTFMKLDLAYFKGASSETIDATRKKLLYHINYKDSYGGFLDWIKNNSKSVNSAVGSYLKGNTSIKPVEEMLFLESLTNSYILDELRVELEIKFNQLTKIRDVTKLFDRSFEQGISMDRVSSLLTRLNKIDKIKSPEEYAALTKELDNVIKYFGGANNLFKDPPIYYGFDTLIGGRVASILTEIQTLQPPMLYLLHPHGPFSSAEEFGKFEYDIHRIEDLIKEDATNIRDSNKLKQLINDYFKFKVNGFTKELDELENIPGRAKYNQKLDEAVDFVMGGLGYLPTEQRRFVLLDLADVDKLKEEHFNTGASNIFSEVKIRVKDANKKLFESIGHNLVTENKTKSASNALLRKVLDDREVLVMQLSSKVEELSKLETRFAAIASNMPEDQAKDIGKIPDIIEESASALSILNMEQFKRNRLLLKNDIVDIRSKIVKLDIDKFAQFDASNPDLYADDAIGGFSIIRAGKINPDAIGEVSSVLSVLDSRNSEKARLMVVLRKIQELHEKRTSLIDITKKNKINEEIFNVISGEISLSDPHKYMDIILPSIKAEFASDGDVDRHIGMIVDAIAFRLEELDQTINKAEKAIQRLKSYSIRIDIPFKRFMRENIIDDGFRLSTDHIILSMKGEMVSTVEVISPSLITGADGAPGLPFDLMKRFGLLGDRAFLFPDRVGAMAVYKLHIPINATPAQANALITEAEIISHGTKGLDALVVEFPSKMFGGFIPDEKVYPKLYKYYALSDIERKSVIENFNLFGINSKPSIIGSGYHYDISRDGNKIRKYQTIIAKAPVDDIDDISTITKSAIDPDTQLDIYNRIRVIVDDIGTPIQKSIMKSEIDNIGIENLEKITPMISSRVNEEKRRQVGRVVKEGGDKLFEILRSKAPDGRLKGWESAEFPVVVYVDKNNNIRTMNLGFRNINGELDPYTQIILNSGKGFKPHDAKFSIIVESMENRFRIIGAEGVLPKDISFNSMIHTATELISAKTRTQYTTDMTSIDRDIQTSFYEMNKEISRIGLTNQDIEYINEAEGKLKSILTDKIQDAMGSEVIEKMAMEEYQKGIRQLYGGLVGLNREKGIEGINIKWQKYSNIKTKYLGEAGKDIYGYIPETDGIITSATKIGSAFGVSIWFDQSIPVQSISSSYIDLQIKEAYAALTKEPQKATELYAKLDALKTMRSHFVNMDSRTLIFNPSLNAIYNDFMLRQLIDIDLRYARVVDDKTLQDKVLYQIELLRNSIKREEDLASKIRAFGVINERWLWFANDNGKFIGGEELYKLRHKAVLTNIEKETLSKLEQKYGYFVTLTTTKSQLISDIDKMMLPRVDSSNLADWFKLRSNVVNIIAKEWLSNIGSSMARVLPKTTDFWNSINGSPVKFINLFATKDTINGEVENIKKKIIELKAEYNWIIGKSGISELRAEYKNIKEELDGLNRNREQIINKWTHIFSDIATSGDISANTREIIQQLNGGVPFFNPEVVTRMKYVLRIRLDELAKEKTDDANKQIIDINDVLNNFDELNKRNMVGKATSLGVDKLDQEILAARNRLVVIESNIGNIKELPRAERIDAEIIRHTDLLGTLNAELDSVVLKIKQLPSVIADDAQYIYTMKIQPNDQVERLNRILDIKKNEFSKAGGDIAGRVQTEITKLENDITIIRDIISAHEANMKVVEDRLAQNVLQYDDVKVANLAYINEQINKQTISLKDMKEQLDIEMSRPVLLRRNVSKLRNGISIAEINIKKLKDTKVKKDLYDELSKALNDLGVVQSERLYVLANAGKVLMEPKYTRRLIELQEQITALKSKVGELTGQLSVHDPFYTASMLKHDYEVLKKVFSNLVKAVKLPPKQIETIAQNNLVEIYVKKYIQVQFARKFNNAANEVDQFISDIAIGKKVSKDTVANIIAELNTKSINDFIFLNQKYNDEFKKAAELGTDVSLVIQDISKSASKLVSLTAKQKSELRVQFILKDVIDFIESQKVMVPSTKPEELGKLVPMVVDYDPGQIKGPLKDLVENLTVRYADNFDVVSVDRFKLLTLLSRNVDKGILKINITKAETKAHDLRVKLNNIIIERDAAYKVLIRENANEIKDNLKIGNLERKIKSLFRKQTELDMQLTIQEELVLVGKAFSVRSDDIVHLSKVVPFKETVLDFLHLSLAKEMLTKEWEKIDEVDQQFKIVRTTSDARRARIFKDLESDVLYRYLPQNDLGEAILGIVDGVLKSTKDYNVKTSREVATELEKYLRSAGVNINSTFKVAGWNLPRARKTLNKALLINIDSPVFTAALRQVAKKHGIILDEFAFDLSNSLLGMSGISKDHYGRNIVGALRRYMGERTYEFISALATGSIEVPFASLQRGLTQKEAEEYRNLLVREKTLAGVEFDRFNDLKRWSESVRVMPKFEYKDDMLKSYIRTYALDDGRIVIASNQVMYDPNFALIEPRFRILKVLHEKPLGGIEKYLFENYNADRKIYSNLLINPSYDSRGLVAMALRIILKDRFNIVVDAKIVDDPSAIYMQYYDKLNSISLKKLLDQTVEVTHIAKEKMKVNPDEWVKLLNETTGGVQETFLNILRAAGVDDQVLIRSDEWFKIYQKKVTEYGKVHEQVLRIKKRISKYESDIFNRINGPSPQGVQISLNPKSIVDFLTRGTIGEDIKKIAGRYEQKPILEQLLGRNKDRKLFIESLLLRAKTNIRSIGVVDGKEYTIDDIGNVATVLEEKMHGIIDILEKAGIQDSRVPDFRKLKFSEPETISKISKALDLIILNTISNAVSPSYKYKPSLYDDVLEKIAMYERKLVGIPFVSADLKIKPRIGGQPKPPIFIEDWMIRVKLSDGSTIESIKGIQEKLESLNKIYLETKDITEKRLIQVDIDRVGIVSDIIDKLKGLYNQDNVLNAMMVDSGKILRQIELYNVLSSINNDIINTGMSVDKRLARINRLNIAIKKLVGTGPYELGGYIGKLKSKLGTPHINNRIKTADKILKKLRAELNGLAKKDTPSAIRIAERSSYGGFVLHTVDELTDELKSIHSVIDDLTHSLPKLDEVHIFKRMMRPIQEKVTATNQEIIKNIDLVIDELNITIALKNNLVRTSLPNKQKYISGIIIAGIDAFDKKMKRLRGEIEEARKINDQNKVNQLLVDLNDLTERRKVIIEGRGKMFVDKYDILSTSNIDMQLSSAYRALRKAEGNKTETGLILGEIKRLQELLRTPVNIKQIDETESLNKMVALQKKLTIVGKAASPQDWAEYKELIEQLNRIGDAGLHIKMNSRQIAIFDRLGILFEQSKKMSNSEWMNEYKNEYNKLIAELDEVSDIFMGAKYINSTYHNFGLMMQRDMSIEQILHTWYKDAGGILDTEVKIEIDQILRPINDTEMSRIVHQIDKFSVELEKTNDVILQKLYGEKITTLQGRLNEASQRGFRKYQETFYVLNMQLKGGINEKGLRIKGLVAQKMEFIEKIKSLEDRLSKLDILLDAGEIEALNIDLFTARGALSTIETRIINIERALKMRVGKNTEFYTGNIQQFKNIAITLPLTDDELKYINGITTKFSISINEFLPKLWDKFKDNVRLRPSVEHMYALMHANNISAIDAMQAIVDEMSILNSYSIPNGEQMAGDIMARYRIEVGYFDSGDIKIPISMDRDSAVSKLMEAIKDHKKKLDALPAGFVEMSDQQIQSMREYLDRLHIPEVTKAKRDVYNDVLSELVQKGYDSSKPNAEADKVRILKTITADRRNMFLNAEREIKRNIVKNSLGEEVKALMKDIKIQTDLAHIRARIAKYRAEVMLIENMVYYNQSDALTKEVIKLTNAKGLLGAYKRAVDVVEKVGKDIRIPNRVQKISMNVNLVKELANTYERMIYTTNLSGNGVPISELVSKFNEGVDITALTEDRMRILRKISKDIANKVSKETNILLDFKDDNVFKEAYKLMSKDGGIPLYKYIGIADITKDSGGQFVPIINGVIDPTQSLSKLSDISWRDPFKGYISDAPTEVQLLEEYLKASFIYADNITIRDTLGKIVETTMEDKIDRIINVMRERIPNEWQLNALNKAFGAVVATGVITNKIVKEAVVRIDKVQGSINGFMRSLLNGVSEDSIKELYTHAATAKSYYKKGAKFVKYFGGRGDIGSLLRKLAINTAIKQGTTLANTAEMIFGEETRRTLSGIKNIVNAASSGAYLLSARATTDSLNQIAAVAQPLPWDMTGPQFMAMWDKIEREGDNWQNTIFDKRADTVLNRLLGRVNKAGNDMNRKMAQGVMPSLAVGGAVNEVRGAYARAADDLEGMISDAGYTAFNQSAMSNYIDNADQIRYFEYTAINDSRTCKYCRATHGILYKPEEPRPQLPRHPNCRCTYRPWFKSISSAAEELEQVPRKPRVPIGAKFDIGPDDFAGFGDGLSKLIKPIKPDGTISDEDWIMWFNKQPFDIRQMMVGDEHDLANSLGVFGVDAPIDKKALIVSASKNVGKVFAKDMATNSVRQLMFNTFTNSEVYSSLFDIWNSPKKAMTTISSLAWKRLMFGPGGIIKNSVTEAFNRSVNGLIPIDPNEAGPLQALINRVASTKTFNKASFWWNMLGGKFINNKLITKLSGMAEEERAVWGKVAAGDTSEAAIAEAYTKAIGMRNKKVKENSGFLQSEFMRAIDPWFNIGVEGVAPLADMSIVHRTEIFQQLAKDIITLPEDEAIAARLRPIMRNKNHISNSIFNSTSFADDGLYRIQDLVNTTVRDTEKDVLGKKEVLDIYGKLMGTQRSSAKILLTDEAFKGRLLRLPENQRTILLDLLHNPTIKSVVKKFYIDSTTSIASDLEAIRVIEITPQGMRVGIGGWPTREINNITIGPDGMMYNATKEELISMWKKADPRVDISRFVSIDVNIGGRVVETSPTISFDKMSSKKLDDIKKRQAVIKKVSATPDKNIYEYIFTLKDKDVSLKNRGMISNALMRVQGMSPFSLPSKIDELIKTGVLKVGQGNPAGYGEKYVEAINKIEGSIKQVLANMKNELTPGDKVIGRIGEDKVSDIATSVRGNIKDILSPYGEYKFVHVPINQFVGETIDSEAFLSRIRLLAHQMYGV